MKHYLTINEESFTFSFGDRSTKSRDIINQLLVTHNLPYFVRFLKDSIQMYRKEDKFVINMETVVIYRKRIIPKVKFSIGGHDYV